MADLNVVALVGRLTRDAELKYTNSGVAICKLGIAVNRRVKKEDTWQDEASFFDAVLIGRRGEAIAQYLVKGKQIGLRGELRQDRWEQDGQNRSRVEIFVNDIQLIGGGGGRGAGAEPAGPAATGRGGSYQESPPADNFDDDIPF